MLDGVEPVTIVQSSGPVQNNSYVRAVTYSLNFRRVNLDVGTSHAHPLIPVTTPSLKLHLALLRVGVYVDHLSFAPETSTVPAPDNSVNPHLLMEDQEEVSLDLKHHKVLTDSSLYLNTK